MTNTKYEAPVCELFLMTSQEALCVSGEKTVTFESKLFENAPYETVDW